MFSPLTHNLIKLLNRPNHAIRFFLCNIRQIRPQVVKIILVVLFRELLSSSVADI